MIGNRHIRQRTATAGLAVTAAVLGMGVAHADGANVLLDATSTVDPSTLLDNAASNLTDATQVLSQISSSTLDARELLGIAGGEQFQTDVAQQIASIETFQEGLSATNQASPWLLDADTSLAQSTQELLTADQGFASAANAGDLSTFTEQWTAQLPVIEGVLATYGSIADVEFTDLVAQFDPSLLLAIGADSAASIAGTAADPGIFADLLSSIGL